MKSRKLFAYAVILSVAVLSITSCRREPGTGTTGGCAVSARWDGKNYCGTGYFIKNNETGAVSIITVSDATNETLSFVLVKASVGTYDLKTGDNVGATLTTADQLYFSTAGTLKITKSTTTVLAGTFSFTGGPMLTEVGNKEVTNGTFSIKRLGL